MVEILHIGLKKCVGLDFEVKMANFHNFYITIFHYILRNMSKRGWNHITAKKELGKLHFWLHNLKVQTFLPQGANFQVSTPINTRALAIWIKRGRAKTSFVIITTVKFEKYKFAGNLVLKSHFSLVTDENSYIGVPETKKWFYQYYKGISVISGPK